MIKAILLLALAALAVAGPVILPTCNKLANEGFDAPDTVVPWLETPYLGGTSDCGFTGPLQCQLLQMNGLNGGSNSGRISVGQGVSTCVTNPGESVGMNVYQPNIGMCRGLVMSVDIGMQDRRSGSSTVREPTKFSIVVGYDAFDLNGGEHTVVASTTIMPPTEAPFTELQQDVIQGTWNGPAECIEICPFNNCYAVGVRFERNENISPNVRLYMDNFDMHDITPPTISFEGQTVQAGSCGGMVTVTLGATATDNCCHDIAVVYEFNDLTTDDPIATFDVGCHDVKVTATDLSGNMADQTVRICVMQPEPTISCSTGNSFQTESCWSTLPEGNNVVATPGVNCDGASVTYSPTLDSEFRLGVSTITASFQQANGLDGNDAATWTASCDLEVQFTMCCSAEDTTKRSVAPLQKLRKF